MNVSTRGHDRMWHGMRCEAVDATAECRSAMALYTVGLGALLLMSTARMAAASGPGICSNDKTLSCAANADCGAGNTCYLPTAGRQTLSNQVCMATAAGLTPPLNCTANDVSIAQTTNLVFTPCHFPGDTSTISFVAQFNSTATSRYDVGVWVAQ